MAEARDRARWNHTSNLLAAILEPYRDRDAHPDPYDALDFHPYHTREQADAPETPIRLDSDTQMQILKHCLVDTFRQS